MTATSSATAPATSTPWVMTRKPMPWRSGSSRISEKMLAREVASTRHLLSDLIPPVPLCVTTRKHSPAA
jgi:hypothetical protein